MKTIIPIIQRLRKVRVDMPVWVYSLVALLILGPLLRPGFILTLDMVFTPQLHMPPEVTSGYLMHVLLHVVDLALPADLIQKILLFTVLTLTGLGLHRLVQELKAGEGAALYAAGLLYMVNPFTYERFMAGQYNVLFGYALLPWFVRSVIRLAQRTDRRSVVMVMVWGLVLSIMSIHSVVPAALAASLVLGWRLIVLRARRQEQGRLLRAVVVVVTVTLLGSSYWLVPLIAGTGSQAELIGSFSQQDRQAFATGGGNVVGRLGNALRLQGFWPERHGLFVLPQDVLPGLLWGMAMAVVVGLAIIGAAALWRRGEKGLLLLSLSLVMVGALLGAGIGNDWWGGLPFFAGYREPHKFVVLVALGYALLVPVGLMAILKHAEQHKQEVLSGIAVPLALALPFLIAPSYLFAAKGQLQAVQYPDSWYAVNDRLNRESTDSKALFLPWHLYMHTNFAGRIIANPAPKFFDRPMIVSGDPELGGAAYNKPSATSSQVDVALDRARDGSKGLTATLTALDIEYVILAKENDYQRYAFLDRQSDLRPILDYPEIGLYHNENYKPQ